MSRPTWITKAGTLGTIPELEYFQFPLDAYDATGGTLVYSIVSGRLPLGVQLVTATGVLKGIPVSEQGEDQNVDYRFSVRVQNTSTNSIADRTFAITVTNVVPPVIVPRNVDLGIILDGSIIDIQLDAVESTPSAVLNWSLNSGELPPGVTFTSDGRLTGYLEPIPSNAPGTTIGWDQSAWSNLGWDFPLFAISKVFTFTVEVTDGVNYDLSTYSIKVFPRFGLTADNEDLPSDSTVVTSDIDQNKHYPIITTTQDELLPVRQGSYFSFNVDAIDLDGETLQYVTTTLFSGAFDEQNIIGEGIPYVAAKLIGGDLYAGIFPRADVVELDDDSTTSENIIDFSTMNYQPGDVIKVIGTDNYWRDATITSDIVLQLTGDRKVTGNVGEFLTQAVSGANATINSISDTIGTIAITGNTFIGLIAIGGEGYNSRILNLAGDTITANVGEYISQSVSGANAWVTANVTNANSVPISTFTANTFVIGSGDIALNGANVAAYPSSLDFISISANIGDYITQASTGANALVTANASLATTAIIRYVAGTFDTGNASTIVGNISINGTEIAAYPYAVTRTSTAGSITANPGDFITQPSSGANATVITGGNDVNKLSVIFNSGVFNTTTGNLQVNLTDFTVRPGEVIAKTDIDATYNSANLFIFNSTISSAYANISSANTYSRPTSIISVGAGIGGLSTEGTTGFDEAKFDQGALDLPEGLTFDVNTGWLTGQLPTQTINELQYEFEVSVYKKDLPSYVSSRIFTLTVFGDLYNRIEWVTPTDLGTIENGKISDLFVNALSTKGKTLTYRLTNGESSRLPQGILLTTNGLLVGRASFQLFSFDETTTTIDEGSTTFDNTYTFTVTATDYENTISADQTFTLCVTQRNVKPYENLYLKALPTLEQRTQFQSILTDKAVFPSELLYRSEDQWFGLAKDIKTLFLPGLAPSTIADYTIQARTNHYTKRITFGDVKTAIVEDSNFQTKYEVVYVEIFDENSNADLDGPANTIDLTGKINPYYDKAGNEYTVAYPNSFDNMDSIMVQGIGYVNKGALPDWMTSKQSNGRILGFTRAVVLAYTIPGASELIAYRFREKNYNLNEIDFTVDRYQLDKNYSENYIIPLDTVTFNDTLTANIGDVVSQTISSTSAIIIEDISNGYTAKVQYVQGGFDLFELGNLSIVANSTSNVLINGIDSNVYPVSTSTSPEMGSFIKSTETTFDRYPATSSLYIDAGTVNYALSQAFDEINSRTVDYIKANNGMDGIKNFRDGDRVVFAQQEFFGAQGDLSDYNQGWNNIITLWDGDAFDYDANTAPTTDDLGWDESEYVPGYNEHLLDPLVPNQRAGIWLVHINNNVVTLEFIQEIENYNKIYVRNGFTYGGSTIYYDPIVKEGNLLPNYSIIAQQITLISTRFDGNGTRFTNYRDEYSAPGVGDKYIKFTKTGVFN